MRIAELCVDPRSAADLRWYWTWSDGELGMRSSFGPMVARLQCGGRSGGKPITEIDDRVLEAAARARHISRALALLSNRDHVALRAAFGPSAPIEPVPGLGLVAPVAPLTRCAWQAHRDSHTDRPIEEWLLRLAHRAAQRGDVAACDRVLAREIVAEAEVLLRHAVGAFGSARRAIGIRRSARK